MNVKCKRCGGSGREPVPLALSEILRELRVTHGASAPELLDRFPDVSVTALNNRLERLRQHGLVARKKNGRAWRYFVIEQSGDGADAKRCHADSEGYCEWAGCPQARDNEPDKSGRQCPYLSNGRVG